MKLRVLAIALVLAACGPNRPPDMGGDDTCVGGDCAYSCEDAALDHGYVGCEYWPVDLDNAIEVLGAPAANGCARFGPEAKLQSHEVCWDGAASAGLCDAGSTCPTGFTCQTQSVCALDAQHSPFAIVVSNPDPVNTVKVTLSNASGTSVEVEIAPLDVHALFPQELGFADASVNRGGISAKAYRVVSERPIVAYQFNPLDHVGVFSNDASLLIPTHAYATEYLAMTYRSLPRRPATNDYHGYATVVGVGPGPTTVTVTPTTDVDAGGIVGVIPKGTTTSLTIEPFETLNLEAVASFDPALGDLTGTSIVCSQPCGVFVGHEATTVTPAAAPFCCADHLEEQLFPAQTWGRSYSLAVTMARSTPKADVFRILAQRADTTLTFTPPQTGCPPMLGRGEFCEIESSADLQVTASAPILVGHYLQSAGGLGADSGDPSLSFPAPLEQFRTDYTILVPSQYNANYVNVVTQADGQVFIDGIEIVGLAPMGDGQQKAARLPVEPGQHHVECPSRCGVEVYGWANAVSYLFAGGLDLAPIIE